MTTEKMPDEMYITFKLPGAVYRYIRAEPVEELLKQARGIVEAFYDEYGGIWAGSVLKSINKFLGEDK